jgi:Copper type II ascorbate-dependent monooxygenase, C-terminal domain
MYWTSLRCAQPAAHALSCLLIAVTSAGCEPVASEEAAVDAATAAPFVAAPDAMAALVPDAMAPPADAQSAPLAATTRDAVDANGVRGTLVDTPFLSDMGEGKKSFIEVDWEVPAGRELYLCGRVTVPEDVYFNASYPINPLGTHHTLVSVLDKPNAPDGVRQCDVSEVGRSSVGGSGVGTGGKKMPDGIAMKVARGSQLILNLHLFNTTGAALRGRSGSWVETVLPSQVNEIADGVAVGPLKLNIPPGPSVQTGVCTVEYDYTILGILPHMHEMGRYVKVVAKRALGDEVVLHDGPYDFAHQFAYPINPPLKVAAGDRIEIACTYANTTTQELHFGESSKDEMCIAGLVRFPGGGKSACPY